VVVSEVGSGVLPAKGAVPGESEKRAAGVGSEG
jgi:hypothetical protein